MSNKIRAMVLREKFTAKDLILVESEIETVEMILRAPITASELKSTLDITASNANNMLVRLTKKGYLEREEIREPGVTPYFKYKVPQALRRLLYSGRF